MSVKKPIDTKVINPNKLITPNISQQLPVTCLMSETSEVEYPKRNSISLHALVLFSISS